MFGSLKEKLGLGSPKKGFTIGAVAEGQAVPMSTVNDPTFAQELLGKGVAIIPANGEFVSPVDGNVGLVFETKHAISITSKEGAEVLIHIGLDTVKLKGEHYEAHVQAGDQVKKGDPLLTVDIQAVKAAGYDVITPVIICNTDDYEAVEAITGNVSKGDDVVNITEK